MKEERKKNKSPVTDYEEKNHEYIKEIEGLTMRLVECMREQRTENLDPFEIYVERIKGKLYADARQFHDSFTNGYKVVLDQLAKQISEQKPKAS
jgi:hypothetical protein